MIKRYEDNIERIKGIEGADGSGLRVYHFNMQGLYDEKGEVLELGGLHLEAAQAYGKAAEEREAAFAIGRDASRRSGDPNNMVGDLRWLEGQEFERAGHIDEAKAAYDKAAGQLNEYTLRDPGLQEMVEFEAHYGVGDRATKIEGIDPLVRAYYTRQLSYRHMDLLMSVGDGEAMAIEGYYYAQVQSFGVGKLADVFSDELKN